MLLYFDTSAIVKLMRDEVETAALHRFMKSEPNIYFTCDLSRTEIGRVAIRQQLDPAIVAQTVGVFDILTLDTETYNQAASLPHPFLRSLDAIHLASALELGSELDGIVTYDDRMREAAHDCGLQVFSPR